VGKTINATARTARRLTTAGKGRPEAEKMSKGLLLLRPVVLVSCSSGLLM